MNTTKNNKKSAAVKNNICADTAKLLAKLNKITQQHARLCAKLVRMCDDAQADSTAIDKAKAMQKATYNSLTELKAVLPPVKFNSRTGEYILAKTPDGKMENFVINVTETINHQVRVVAKNREEAFKAAAKQLRAKNRRDSHFEYSDLTV